MGIDIASKNRKAHYRSSYGAFHHLRSLIAHAYNPTIGDIFDKIPLRSISDDDLNIWCNLCNDAMDIFLSHSDCSGILTASECKIILNALGDVCVTFGTYDSLYKQLYDELIDVLKYSVKHRVNLYFS